MKKFTSTTKNIQKSPSYVTSHRSLQLQMIFDKQVEFCSDNFMRVLSCYSFTQKFACYRSIQYSSIDLYHKMKQDFQIAKKVNKSLCLYKKFVIFFIAFPV